MRTLSLLALLAMASLFSVTRLSAQCTPQMNISVYDSGAVSDNGSTVYAYSSTVDSSTLCTCVHSDYQTTALVELANGTYVSNTESGDDSSVSSPTDGDGTYSALGGVTLNCSCYGNLGAAGIIIVLPPPPPTITGIADASTWSNTIYPGVSGYLAIFGTTLTAMGQTPMPIVTGDSSVTIGSVTYASDGQVNVSYTVAANAATGQHTVRLTTAGGTAAFQIQVGCATPTNFQQFGQGADVGGGTLQFHYTWNSSTGRIPDLQACSISEYVSYPSLYNPYTFPSPFPPDNVPNPTMSVPLIPGTNGGLEDNHSTTGTFIKPYFYNSFTATQQYQWQCVCSANNAWQPFAGYTGIPINRSVNLVPPYANVWDFVITKSGASATINPLP